MSNFLLHSAKARYQRGSMHYLQRDERRGRDYAGRHAPGAARRLQRHDRAADRPRSAVAAGQLHHHFASIGELKSQVFIRLIREMLDMPLVAEDASWRERLFSMIGSEDGRLEPYIRLWREGPVLADSDPDIKAAYLLTMTMWHAETVAIVEQGLACGEFHSTEPPADIAWRFIALVCGLDGIYALGTQTLDDGV